MDHFTSSVPKPDEQPEVKTNLNLFFRFTYYKVLFCISLLLLNSFCTTSLTGQSSDCIPGQVQNANDDDWSEQCYLGNDCAESGNPCQASDVTMLGAFIADENGGPVNTCGIGDPITFLLWAKFHNNTGTDRYAVRTCTEVWINGAIETEVNECSFDHLPSGSSEVVLLGNFTYTCGDDIQLLNTWVGWSTSAAQCTDPEGNNFSSFCGQYPPAKCSKTLAFIDFLIPNFSYSCGDPGSNGTEVCFSNLSDGGTDPLIYNWQFGDGSSSTAVNPCHTYNATSGSYTVLLTVTDANGVQAVAELTIDLDSLNCCQLLFTCPDVNGGSYSCIDELPAPDTDLITIEDACGEVNITVGQSVTGNGCSTDPMIVTRTYIITDGTSTDSCVQFFTFIDNILPTINCPQNVSVTCASLIPPPNTGGIVASDNCDGNGSLTVAPDVTTNYSNANNFIVQRTYTATDNCGNSATCIQEIEVFDNIDPIITCPGDITVSCATDVPVADVLDVTATDNCEGIVSISVGSDIISNSNCANQYTITRTFTATDINGNTALCQQTITVDDDSPPAITCPPHVTVSCEALVPSPNLESVIASDNCGSVTITVSPDMITEEDCTNGYLITRVYVATDVCGNSSFCAQFITVHDEVAPTITCPADITVTCASLIPPADPLLPVTDDNCEGPVAVTVAPDVTTGFICNQQYTLNRVYTATDMCGNTTSCVQQITVSDITVPTIECVSDITVSCASEIPAPFTEQVVVSDNCSGIVTVTVAPDVTTSQVCANNFVIERTYTAADECGNAVSCTQTIAVLDDIAPSLVCPDDITLACAGEIPLPDISEITSTDNCGGAVTVEHSGDEISGSGCDMVINRTFIATDACGNTTTCIQQITLLDTTAPAIVFAHPLLENIPNGGTFEVQCYGQNEQWDLPQLGEDAVSVSDNCSEGIAVVFTQRLVDEGTCQTEGYLRLYQLSWLASDECGNEESTFVFMAMIDTLPPVIEGVPEDITISGNELPELPSVIATDECLCACIMLLEESGLQEGCLDGQVLTRRWRATDHCGNEAIAIQKITMMDTTGPAILLALPEDVPVASGDVLLYTCEEGGIPSSIREMNETSVIFSDLSGEVDVNFGMQHIQPNNCEFAGFAEQMTMMWMAADLCGNTSTFTLTAQLMDDSAPEIINVPVMACFDDPLLDLIDVRDNCQNASLRFWDVSTNNPCGEGLAMRRTYEAFDGCGNMTRDTVLLTPDDETPPVMEFIHPSLQNNLVGGTITVSCSSSGQQMTDFGVDDVRVVDGCLEGLDIQFSEKIVEMSDCATDEHLALVELLWTATDQCGNFISRSVMANVVDDVPPVFDDFEKEITLPCHSEIPTATATDLCSEVRITYQDSVISSVCIYEYDIKRLITATDACGNAAYVTQVIHIGDGLGPVIEGVEPEVCDDLSMPLITAFDRCAGVPVAVSMVQDTPGIACRDGFVVRRIWSAVDACGNVNSVEQFVIIGDETAPQLLVPGHSVIRDFMDQDSAISIFASQTDLLDQLRELDENSVFVVDNCNPEITPVFTMTVIESDNIQEDGFSTQQHYAWVAEDVCGNVDSIAFTLNIIDDVPPVAELPEDITVICSPLPPPISMLPDGDEEVTTVFTETMQAGSQPGEFIVLRSWIFTDMSGNVTTRVQRITWIPDTFLECDILLPENVECNSHDVVISSDVNGGIEPYSYLWEVVGEKCFIREGQHTPEIEIYVGWSDVTINLFVNDTFGCSTMCTAVLTCDDVNQSYTGTDNSSLPGESGDVLLGVGLFESNTLTDFEVWPNPTDGTTTVGFLSEKNNDVTLSLVGLLGEVVFENTYKAQEGKNSIKMDLDRVPDGQYLVRLQTSDKLYARKLMIMRKD